MDPTAQPVQMKKKEGGIEGEVRGDKNKDKTLTHLSDFSCLGLNTPSRPENAETLLGCVIRRWPRVTVGGLVVLQPSIGQILRRSLCFADAKNEIGLESSAEHGWHRDPSRAFLGSYSDRIGRYVCRNDTS